MCLAASVNQSVSDYLHKEMLGVMIWNFGGVGQ